MRADLPYADGTITVSLPAGTRRLSSEEFALPPLADLDGAVGAVLDELALAGVPRSRVRLVCANALHRQRSTASWPPIRSSGYGGWVA